MLNWLHPGVRISNAIRLMQTTDLSVTQIAYEVGFVEMLTFAREFKKHTLMTPKDFKARSILTETPIQPVANFTKTDGSFKDHRIGVDA